MKRFVKPVWELFKVFLMKVGHVQARILLTLVYGIFIIPAGIFVGLFSDWMGTKRKNHSTHWLDRKPDPPVEEFAKRQF